MAVEYHRENSNEMSFAARPLRTLSLPETPIVKENFIDPVSGEEDWFDCEKVRDLVFRKKQVWHWTTQKQVPVSAYFDYEAATKSVFLVTEATIAGKKYKGIASRPVNEFANQLAQSVYAKTIFDESKQAQEMFDLSFEDLNSQILQTGSLASVLFDKTTLDGFGYVITNNHKVGSFLQLEVKEKSLAFKKGCSRMPLDSLAEMVIVFFYKGTSIMLQPVGEVTYSESSNNVFMMELSKTKILDSMPAGYRFPEAIVPGASWNKFKDAKLVEFLQKYLDTPDLFSRYQSQTDQRFDLFL